MDERAELREHLPFYGYATIRFTCTGAKPRPVLL